MMSGGADDDFDKEAVERLKNETRANREELRQTQDRVRRLEDALIAKEEENMRREEDRLAFQRDVLQILRREGLMKSSEIDNDEKQFEGCNQKRNDRKSYRGLIKDGWYSEELVKFDRLGCNVEIPETIKFWKPSNNVKGSSSSMEKEGSASRKSVVLVSLFDEICGIISC